MTRLHSSVTQLSPTANETQDVASAGLQSPIGALFMGVQGGTALDTLEANATPFIGATDFTRDIGVSTSSRDAQGTSDSSTLRSATKSVVQNAIASATAVIEANYNAAINHGLQLDFTTTDESDFYSALMLREGISSIRVRDITLLATGVTDVELTTATLPDVTIFVCGGAATGGADEAIQTVGIFARVAGTYYSIGSTIQDAQGTMASERRASAAEIIVRMDPASGDRDAVTIGAIPAGTGYRLTKTVGTTAVSLYAIEIILAQGYELEIGSFATPAAGVIGNHRVIRDLGFNPQLLFLLASPVSTIDTDTASSLFGFGWASFDGTQAAIGSSDRSGVGTSKSQSYHTASNCIAVPDVQDPRLDILASVLAFNAENAITLNFTKNAIGNQLIGYLAIGKSDDASSLAFPVRIGKQNIKTLVDHFNQGMAKQWEYEFSGTKRKFYQNHNDT